MLTQGSKRKRGSDVRLGELRKVTDDLVVRHATGQVFEHVVHRDPGADEARLAAADSGPNVDERREIHEPERTWAVPLCSRGHRSRRDRARNINPARQDALVIVDRAVPLVVRRRVEADIDECVRIAAAVQENNGYPGRRPRDLRAFLHSSDVRSAWVAEYDGSIAGHVAMHRESLRVVMERAAAVLNRDAAELAVIARLIGAPALRRLGIGRALLGWHAAGEVTMVFGDGTELQSFVYVAPYPAERRAPGNHTESE